MTRRLAVSACSLLLVIVFFTTGCSDDTERRVGTLSGSTMGTTWSVTFTGTPRGGVPAFREAIESALEKVNDEMSTYRENSALSQFNAGDAETWHALPDGFLTVMQASIALSEASQGYFDVTVGPLVNLWGFGPDGRRNQAPDQDMIDQRLQRVGWQQLVLEDGRLYQPGGLYVDLSAIAKGYGVDQVMDVATAAGLRNALVDIGGDLRAMGHRPDGQPWRIGIEKPEAGVRDIAMIVGVDNVALVSSGDYRNFFEDNGEWYSHTIDPTTGYPVTHQLASVTVVHPDSAMLADGHATAILAMGPEKGLRYAEDNELAVLLIVRTNKGPEFITTPQFKPFILEH